MMWGAPILGITLYPFVFHRVFHRVDPPSSSTKEVRTSQWCLGEHSSSKRFREAEHLGNAVIHKKGHCVLQSTASTAWGCSSMAGIVFFPQLTILIIFIGKKSQGRCCEIFTSKRHGWDLDRCPMWRPGHDKDRPVGLFEHRISNNPVVSEICKFM